jgi:hypothetical protein
MCIQITSALFPLEFPLRRKINNLCVDIMQSVLLCFGVLVLNNLSASTQCILNLCVKTSSSYVAGNIHNSLERIC